MSGAGVARRVTAVVGNPKAQSRTYAVADALAAAVAASLGTEQEATVDLAPLAPQLIEFGNAQVADVIATLRASSVIVVASPTYKATYSGLLKLLFDQISAGELRDTVAIPVMLGGSAHHALAVDVHLRPLLLEVGCSCPTPSLFLLESELGDHAERAATWVEHHRHLLAAG